MKRIALVIVAVMFAAGGPAAQDLERLFKAAVNTETVDRNLKAAIEQYRKVAAGGNRALAAQALLRMAECHWQLGNDAEAQRAYERIVREFADGPEAVVARGRLAGRSPERSAGTLSGTGVGAEQLWNGGDIEGDPSLSPDGRFLVYSSWSADGNLLLKDLGTGHTRALTRDAAFRTVRNGAQAYAPVFSPDGRRIAYSWYESDGTSLRVVERESGKVAVISRHPAVDMPGAWSPDARLIALGLYEAGQSRLALASVPDGRVTTLLSTRWQKPDIGGFSPDGKWLVYAVAGETAETTGVFAIAVDGSARTKLADGADPAWTPDGRAVAFVSDRSGEKDLWLVPVSDGKPTGAPSLLKRNVSINHGFTRNGDLLYGLRGTGRDILQASIDWTGVRPVREPSLLVPASVGANGGAAWSADGRQVAFIRGAEGAAKQLIVRTVSTGEERVIARTSSAPRAQTSGVAWFPDGRFVLVSDRGDGRERYKRIDVRTGQEEVVFEGAVGTIGRAELSPDASFLIYVQRVIGAGTVQAPSALRLIRRDLATGAERELHRRTEAGYRPFAISPDARQIAFIDDSGALALLPIAGGDPRIVVAAATDLNPVTWTRDGAYIIAERQDRFVEREHDQLWAIPVNGGTPVHLGISADRIDAVSVSPADGTLAYSVTQRYHELWLTRNLLKGHR